MAEQPTTAVTCPFCGYPYPMTDLQREIYAGRNMGCMNCGKPFPVPGPAPAAAAGPADAGASGERAAASSSSVALDGGGSGAAPGAAAVTVPGAAGQVSAAADPFAQQPQSNAWAWTGLGAGIVFFVLLAVTAITAYVGASASGGEGGAGEAVVTVLLGLSLAAGLLAVVGGAAGWVRSRRPRAVGRATAAAALGLGVAGLVVAACLMTIVLPGIRTARAAAARDGCDANLQAINAALAQYAGRTPGGALPPDLATLVGTGDLTPDVLLCPGDAGVPHAVAARPPGGGVVAAASSYAYYGTGQAAATVGRYTVLVCEPAGHHPDGSHVLFADGRVVLCNPAQAAQLVAELGAGQNPPSVAAAMRP